MSVSIPIFKFHIKNWKSCKEKILQKVLSSPSGVPENVYGKRGCETSYFVKYDQEVYKDFLELISPVFDLIKNYGITIDNVKHVWYQKYVKGDHHPMHNHENAKWSGIFYANYNPLSHEPTVFSTKEKLNLNIVEGDPVLFPGLLFHEVPPSKTDIERVIFSFNTD